MSNEGTRQPPKMPEDLINADPVGDDPGGESGIRPNLSLVPQPAEVTDSAPDTTNPGVTDSAPGSTPRTGNLQLVPELITSVPGFERPVAEVAEDAVNNVDPDSRIVKDINFMGDPRRVPGHPSNPMSNMDMSAAFGEQKPQEPEPLQPGGIENFPKS